MSDPPPPSPNAAEEAIFGRRRGRSSWVLALSVQVVTVAGLLGLAKLRGPAYARKLTETMVEFTAPPPRPHEQPPPPPPPPPAPRPRPIVRRAPTPAPTAPPPPRASEAPPVMTAPGHSDHGERVVTGHNTDFRGGAVQHGATGNAPEPAPSPPSPPPRPGPIQLPENGEPPEPLDSNAPPEYPAEARAQGVEVTVIATVVIDESGRVTRVIIRRGHPLFDEAVRHALASWRYRPARVAGEAVEVYWKVRVPFRLDQG